MIIKKKRPLISPAPPSKPGGKTAYDDLLAFFKASRMVLDFDEIELKSVIGSGAFATVFRGIFRHKVGRPGEGGDKKMVRERVTHTHIPVALEI